MKKYTYFLYIALFAFITSCSNDLVDGISSNQENKINVEKQVSLDEAKAFVDKFMTSRANSDISLKKKSFLANNDYDILPITSESGTVVMYSINYNDNGGYLLLSADKEDKTILALNDSGRFDMSSIRNNPAMNSWLQEKSLEIEKSLISKVNIENQKYGLWNYITNEQDTIVEIQFIVDKNTDGKNTKSHKGSYNLPWVNPSTGTVVQWGQQSPYNYHAKVSGALAGCPAVAVGMLCFNYSYPYNSNWPYWYMPYKLTSTGDNHIARMFRDIADQIPDYTWGTNASGAMPNDIVTGIKRLGYEDVRMINYDFRTVHTNLVRGYPVLIGGYASIYGGGHIWYCDGYKEITYHVKRTVLGIVVDSWYEYEDMLYMNWGWNGDSNGWYNETDFGGMYNVQRQIYVNLYPPY
ncbi:C10 family peptidase [Dysgonomonas mossii]|uniref:Spi protease inhibitor domain-containing protein n=1 Tax=Dysgonomonas mossii TaxID=163665 RepID=A0A4Y9ILW9_9BACT|nr:C10 family peptidase [Dysgonomonas mossii]MBF0761705.1 C10 family peptidase [Dysgonomonas mossii]TFU89341.1 hypothetical protein E4T88_11675 [Dysgonomonas mossii]